LGVRIEPLGRQHDRAAFSCGEPDLDDWFRRRASQDEKRNVARVFVAVDDASGVVGFYRISSFTLSIQDLPEEIGRKLPRYDALPAALIGRLARDQRARGRGVGELLLADAVRRILGAGRSLAVFAIVVDAKNDRAAKFYRGFGFRAFPLRPSRLYLPTATAVAGFSCSWSVRSTKPTRADTMMGTLTPTPIFMCVPHRNPQLFVVLVSRSDRQRQKYAYSVKVIG
jgi:ribosomal protein S18 acetylase RimI-like enzyme